MTTGHDQSGVVPEAVLRAVGRGAEAASAALSRWLGREARITVNRVRLSEIVEATEALGPGEAEVISCAIPLAGPLPGTVLMTFDDRSAMTMIDALLGQAEGTTTGWGPMEQSAAQETANIVVCAFVNALSEGIDPRARVMPGPPEFRIEFAASLLEFTLMDQASRHDRIVLIETRFSLDGVDNDWSLIIVPEAGGLGALGIGTGEGDGREDGALPSEGRP